MGKRFSNFKSSFQLKNRSKQDQKCRESARFFTEQQDPLGLLESEGKKKQLPDKKIELKIVLNHLSTLCLPKETRARCDLLKR